MSHPIPVIASSLVLSALVSTVIVLTLSPTPPTSVVPGAEGLRPRGSGTERVEAEVAELRRSLDALTLEVASLRRLPTPAQRVEASAGASDSGVAGATGGAFEEALTSRQGGDLLRSSVEDVLASIEEERAAEEWEAELEERREEAERANEEYDRLDAELDDRMQKLNDRLVLSPSQSRDLRKLVALQNERNRDMTHLWSEGKTSDEDLEAIFMENRAHHREEIARLLGTEKLGAYRQVLRGGGLGGRFAFFVGPAEDWSEVSK